MQKLPEAPDREWGNASAKKRNRPGKRERFALTPAEPFRLKGLSSTQPLAGSPLDFTCRLCQLLASQHIEASNMKAPLNVTTQNLDLLTTGDDWYLSAPNLGETMVLKWSRKTFPRYWVAVRIPKWNKVEIVKISSLSAFLPYSSFAAFTDKKTPNNLRCGKKKSKWNQTITPYLKREAESL